MKNLTLFLALILIAISVMLSSVEAFAQVINIPDANFKAALVANSNINTNLDGEIQVSEASAFSDTINVNSLSITDLTGIEAFTALTNLSCYNNALTSLNVSANTALTYLNCYYNQLTSLNLSANTALTSFDCSYNQLTSLDISANTALITLFCNDNQLTNLNLSANTALASLLCNNNQLTSLNLSVNTAIDYLYCNSNLLTSLDLSANTALSYLDCNNNLLTSLNLSTNTAVNTLYCFLNQITSLNLSSNTALAILYCSSNQIASLDLSSNTALATLYCSDNQLTSLNIKNGNNINFYDFDATGNTGLSCIQVDNAAYMNSNWASAKDVTASFSEFCSWCIVNIPDTNFKTALLANAAINTISDSEIQCSEAAAYTGAIDVNQMSISDLSGIEAFTALTELYCYGNNLTSLDISQNTALTKLYCYINSISNLDVSNNTALTHLVCNGNPLNTLDISANTQLQVLGCYSINISNLDLSNNPNISELACGVNQLTSLDLSNNTLLTYIDCGDNQITSLNLSSQTLLTDLFCQVNNLTSLNIQNGNNINFIFFDATVNPNLICVQVDDTVWANANWPASSGYIDSTAHFSIDCAAECIVYIPDLNLKSILVGSPLINLNSDTEIQCSEATAWTGGLSFVSANISDLTGLETFVNVGSIEINFNPLLTSADFTGMTSLMVINCGANNIANLNVSNNSSLTDLLCSQNQITSLILPDSLKVLECSYNMITNLDISNLDSLYYLDCNTNNLISLNIKNGNNINFETFDATINPDLTCIQVDDTVWANINWSAYIDSTAHFSVDCSAECIINIPDANFKAALVANALINTNSDGEIQCSEATAYTDTININFMSIADLTGIEAFTSITVLECGGNLLTNLALSANTALTDLNCAGNFLTSLDISSNISLNTLYCVANQLTSLDVSANIALVDLDCDNNLLTSLNVSTNTLLSTLNCGGNQLTSLDVSADLSLTYLICGNNQLTSLDVSANTALTELDCGGSLLTSLNVKNGNNINFTFFWTVGNPDLNCIQVDNAAWSTTNWLDIDTGASFSEDCSAAWCIVNIPDANFKAALVANTAINTNSDSEIQCSEAAAYTGTMNISNKNIADLTGIEAFTALTDLYCIVNQLTSLNVSANTALTYLDCSDNQLSSLNVSVNNALTTLNCVGNQLTSLNVSANTALTELYCGENLLTSLNVSANTSLTTLMCYTNLLTSLGVSSNTALINLDCHENQLTSLDVSANTALIGLDCNSNLLTNLNIKNGNNINLSYFDATSNANLNCVQVDDTAFMNSNWSGAIDAGASYSEDCSQAASLSFSGIITDISCFGLADASINLTVSGGTPPCTFAWSNSATTEDLINLTSGTYIVTVTDSVNTSVTDTFVISMPAPLTLNVNSTNSNCGLADGMAMAEPAGGTFPYTYSWSVAGNNDTLFNLLAGDYVANVTDSHGCTATNNFTIIENPTLTVSILTYNNVTCFGMADGGATVFPSGGGGNSPYTYIWSDGQTTQVATGFAAGIYQITITDGVGCSAVDSITISEPAQVSAPVVSDVNSCFMQPVPDLTAVGTNLNWFSDTALTTLIYSGDSFATGNTVVGIYNYYVTQTVNGCSGSASVISLSINTLPVVNLGNDTSLCPGSIITLDAGNIGSTYVWNDNSTSKLLSVSAQGLFSVTVTDINACTNSDSINVSLLSLASISGTVYYTGGLFPVNTALAELYQANGMLDYNVVSTSPVDAGMQFMFNNVSAGNYVVRIKMIDTIPYVVSTYYDSSFTWATANAIVISDCNDLNIDLQMYEMQQLSGPYDGFISGTIVYAEYGGSKGTFAVQGGKEAGNPVTGGEIYIELEPDDEPIANGQTDTSGFYFIDSLTLGNTYSVYVDIPGFPLITTYSGFTPTALNPGFTNLNFIVDTTGTDGGIYADTLSVLISEFKMDKFSAQIYPNPFTEHTLVKYNLEKTASVKLEILDALGKKISTLSDSEQKEGTYEYIIDSKKLNMFPGIYILMIRVDNTVFLKKVVKVD